jgi:hypothetical protein
MIGGHRCFKVPQADTFFNLLNNKQHQTNRLVVMATMVFGNKYRAVQRLINCIQIINLEYSSYIIY